MAVLQIRVKIESGEAAPKLADTPLNRAAIFCYGGAPYGNDPKRHGYKPQAYDMNNPSIAGAISVSSFARVTFDSANFVGNEALALHIAAAIDAGNVVVEDTAAAGVPLTRAAILAFV